MHRYHPVPRGSGGYILLRRRQRRFSGPRLSKSTNFEDCVWSCATDCTFPYHPGVPTKISLTPQIVIAGVISGHIACKSIYTRIFAGTDRMHKRDFTAVGSWIGVAVALWVIAWIIAEAIPVFSNLLSLMVSPSHPTILILVDYLADYGKRRHSSPAGLVSVSRVYSGYI